MPVVALDEFTANRPGPYRARSASSRSEAWPFWYVCGPDGMNCLSGKAGTVLTTRTVAETLARQWNGDSA